MTESYEVRFTGEAAEDWREAFPDLPPGPEVVLRMEMGPCSECGHEIGDGEVGGLDPEYVTKDGVLVGKHVCADCMKTGL